jgi:hypothetical protein
MEEMSNDPNRTLSAQNLLDRWKEVLELRYEDANDPAFKKFLYRRRTAKGKKKLKSFPLGRDKGYRLGEVEEWERKNLSNMLLAAIRSGSDVLHVITDPTEKPQTEQDRQNSADDWKEFEEFATPWKKRP